MSAPAADRGTRFTESIDWEDGRVSTTGQLLVELGAVDAADAPALAALRALADDLRVHHCELVVRWEEKEALL
jgi:hypothetical protein